MPDSPVQQKSHSAVLSPAEAADRLGIGGAMLRRHAASYEDVFGSLPRDQRGARQYPITAVQRLQHAAELYRTSEVASIADALTTIRDRAHNRYNQAETHDASLAVPAGDRTLALLLTEVQAAQSARERLADQLDQVLALVGANDDEVVTGLQRRVIELQDEVRDLERRNRALVEEIKHLRNDSPVKDERSWWQRITGSTATDV